MPVSSEAVRNPLLSEVDGFTRDEADYTIHHFDD